MINYPLPICSQSRRKLDSVQSAKILRQSMLFNQHSRLLKVVFLDFADPDYLLCDICFKQCANVSVGSFCNLIASDFFRKG